MDGTQRPMAMHRRRRLSQAINTRRGIARELFHVGPSTVGAANWAGNAPLRPDYPTNQFQCLGQSRISCCRASVDGGLDVELSHDWRRSARSLLALTSSRYLFAGFGAGEAASFSKRGSFRSGSNIGSSRSGAGVSGTPTVSRIVSVKRRLTQVLSPTDSC
jgi:hypothetical protein